MKMRHILSGLLLGAGLPVAAGAADAVQACRAELPRSTPDNRFVLQAGGAEVLDKKTGLVWQRCTLGQQWGGGACEGAAQASAWQQALRSALAQGGGWRLPDIKELQSVVEEGCSGPAANLAIFPGTQANWYLTSSPVAGIAGYVWAVHFGNGRSYGVLKSSGQLVRLVRNSP